MSMSIEKVIAKLEAMAKDREDILPGCLGWNEAEPLLEAIALLKTHPEAQPNEALTLEELREMDGKPVWLNVANGVWGLVNVRQQAVFVAGCSICGGYISIYPLADERKAYRRPPEEAGK